MQYHYPLCLSGLFTRFVAKTDIRDNRRRTWKMKTDNGSPRNIDEYIAGFPPDVQAILQEIRTMIKQAAPDAEEAIKYRIPTFVLNGNLVHFAAYKNHIGFYPTPSGIEAFKDELSRYEGAKGSVRFPIDKPMPLSLIEKIVKFRVKEAQAKSKAKI
jgi:uncharacterized protein YdhG (YjbR/CyaY superfamily)